MTSIETLFTNIAETVNNRERSIRTAAWENGRDLAGVRDVLKPQGLWVAWQEKCLNISRQSVYNYILLYENIPDCKTLLQDGITLSFLYEIARKPNPQLAAQAASVQQKARQGKKLTTEDIAIVLDSNQVSNPKVRANVQAANEQDPELGRDIAVSGAVMNFDGHDVPLNEADPSLVEWNAVTSKDERHYRRKKHIEERTQTQSIPCDLKNLSYAGGRYRVTIEFSAPDDCEPVRFLAIVGKRQVTVTEEAA